MLRPELCLQRKADFVFLKLGLAREGEVEQEAWLCSMKL
jgi:hypothetical protein